MTTAEPTVIFETVHGSRAYGLATESSDTDRRGVFVPDRAAFTGYRPEPDQLEPSPEREERVRMRGVADPNSVQNG
jgi:predicted nucleotidyltransferase